MTAIILMSSTGIYLGLAGILLVGVAIYLIVWKKKKKGIEPAKKSLPSDSSYYEAGLDGPLYVNTRNNKIKIRTVKFFGKNGDKDNLIFSSSLAFNFNSDDIAALRLVAPQVIEVGVMNSHELLITKSPAAHFLEFQDDILKHLFIHLNRKYDWMNRKFIISTKINILNHEKEETAEYGLNIHLNTPLKKHLQLGVLISDIPGIETSKNKILAIMSETGVNSINLEKEYSYEWSDLLPKIKEVCASYFTGGIEFIEN